MATTAAESKVSPWAVLIAGWLVPGLGHLLVKKPIRAGLLFAAIAILFFAGIPMGGKLYAWTDDPLDKLGFVANLGNPLLFALGKMVGWGAQPVLIAVAEYGTKFIAVSGLLNVVAAVDAHSLANGRKASE